jgi:hypothetical protein
MPQFPPIRRRHIDHCSLPQWLPLFHRLTFKTRVLPLPPGFVDYLQSDAFLLPPSSACDYEDCSRIPSFSSTDDDQFSSSDSDMATLDPQSNRRLINENSALSSIDPQSDRQHRLINENSASSSIDPQQASTDSRLYDADSDCTDSDTASHVASAPFFPELEREIRSVIEEFDGSVFPKLDWSAPRDSTWISWSGTLRCQNLSEIYLLLKSSDFIAHDLSFAYEHCTEASDDSRQFHLILRRWQPRLHPAMEYRCFIVNHQLVAICQRDYQNYYEFLASMVPAIRRALIEFHRLHIQHQFFDESNCRCLSRPRFVDLRPY